MLRLGIKVGPDNWQEKLGNGLRVCGVEVYYDLAYAGDYPPLFAWLRERGVEAGLHASTMLAGGLVSNLATADGEVRRASAGLYRRAIDAAAEQGMRYVVVHPGSYSLQRIWEGRVFTVGGRTPAREGNRLAIEEVLRLAAYGRERGVELLVENMPAYDWLSYDPLDREGVVDVGFLPYRLLSTVGERGVGLCVDLGHLYAEMTADGNRGEGPYSQVRAATAELAPYARHLHVSTTVPPWNGTDSHNGFLEADYAQGALPTPEQFLSWLRLFPGGELSRPLWVIPEPRGGTEAHLANYHLLSGWLEGVG